MLHGWIKLWRSLREHDLWLEEKFTRGQAWLDMLMMAAHKQTYVRIRGIRVDLEPGQLAVSEVQYAKRWGWSRGKVRRFLAELEQQKEQQIIQQKNNVTTLVTITNWNEYQGNGTTDKTANDTADGQQMIQQTDTDKNGKNGENDKNNNSPHNPPSGGKRRSNMNMKEKHRTKIHAEEQTELMQRIGRWFNRDEETLWSIAEKEALEQVNPSQKEIDGMEAYYTAEIPDDKDIRRRDLYTLLNNWQGEIDRAREHYKIMQRGGYPRKDKTQKGGHTPL